MTVQIPVRIPQEDVERLDAAVAGGRFESRSDAIRHAVEILLKDLREEEIAEAYRRGYGEQPQAESIDGLLLFAASVQADDDTEPL